MLPCHVSTLVEQGTIIHFSACEVLTSELLITPRRVECVPPKPMVIYVDNNGGQGAWLRLFIEVLTLPPCDFYAETSISFSGPLQPQLNWLALLRSCLLFGILCAIFQEEPLTESVLGCGVQQAGGAAAVKQVQVRTSGSSDGYTNLNNKWGSDWETSNAPKFPLDINIVGADGDSVSICRLLVWCQTYGMHADCAVGLANQCCDDISPLP